MDVELDGDAMQGLVAKAIFDSLTPEKRDALLQASIKQLIETPTGSTYDKRSELQRIFDRNVESVANKLAIEKLQNDPDFRAKIDALFMDVIKWLFDHHERRDSMVEAIGEVIRKAITKDKW